MMSALLPTVMRRSMPGCARAKAASARGAKYLAVLTTPTEAVPRSVPASAASTAPQSARIASIRSTAARSSRPASVGVVPDEERSTSGSPTWPCRSCICNVTAGGETLSRCAAPVTEPVLTTAAKTRSCLRVTFRMEPPPSEFLKRTVTRFKFTYHRVSPHDVPRVASHRECHRDQVAGSEGDERGDVHDAWHQA